MKTLCSPILYSENGDMQGYTGVYTIRQFLEFVSFLNLISIHFVISTNLS